MTTAMKGEHMNSGKLEVLIVEESQESRSAHSSVLSSAGFLAHGVKNGIEALNHIATNGNPSLILLEFRRSSESAKVFLEKYRASLHPSTSVILITDKEARDNAREAFELGVDRYILKARLNANELVRMVRATLLGA